jgi:insertion element IS1 protein InsB
LAPWGLHHVYTDGADVYTRHLNPEPQTIGPIQTQEIARTHLTFRTRLKRCVRKTSGFSKSLRRHDMVMGFFVNRDAFGMLV